MNLISASEYSEQNGVLDEIQLKKNGLVTREEKKYFNFFVVAKKFDLIKSKDYSCNVKKFADKGRITTAVQS